MMVKSIIILLATVVVTGVFAENEVAKYDLKMAVDNAVITKGGKIFIFFQKRVCSAMTARER